MTTHDGATAQLQTGGVLRHRPGWSWLPVWLAQGERPDEQRDHGRTGLVLTVMCVGALLICWSFSAGRSGQPGAGASYWLGQAVLVLPAVVRVLAPGTGHSERTALLVGLAILQSFIAWAYSPDQFRFPDELQHLRTVQDVLRTDHLYTSNSYLAVSPGFPGMEIATAALRDLTGMSVFHAGVVVVSLCHAILPVFVLGLVREVCGSSRTAAIAALVYATAPHNAYYNTLFVYGAVALPFFMLTIWAALRSRRPGCTALALLPPFVIAMVSHHLTVAMTLGALSACALVFALTPGLSSRAVRLLLVTILAASITVAWTATTARSTFAYLGGPLQTLLSTLHGGSSRSVAAVRPVAPPPWESLTSMAAAGVTLLLVSAGVVAIWRSRADGVTRWFSVLGAGYPLVLAVRVFASGGAELASRGLTFGMLFAALPVAAALTWVWAARPRVGPGAAILALTLMLAGSVTAGLPPWWERVPRGFVLGGYESGVDRSVQAVGEWAGRETPPGTRVLCDLSVCSVIASYARATASTSGSDIYYSSPERLAPRLAELSLDYVLVDRRITQLLPVTGVYFFRDVQEGQHTTPVNPKLLAKFDTAAGLNRVYDNGFIQAYYTRPAWS